MKEYYVMFRELVGQRNMPDIYTQCYDSIDDAVNDAAFYWGRHGGGKYGEMIGPFALLSIDNETGSIEVVMQWKEFSNAVSDRYDALERADINFNREMSSAEHKLARKVV